MVGASGAPGAGHSDQHGAGEAELTKDERRLRLWAFGTSPYGLGLRASDLWQLSPREFKALRDVHDAALTRWAIQQAMYANVHFRERDEHGKAVDAAFIPEDFLGAGNRAQRTAQTQRDKYQVIMLNARLGKIVKGAPPGPNIPRWALGDQKEQTSGD